ncbi:MAG: O-phospho-L-seryl-tRNA:Cys-tRNA synthase [Methermicoccaceae archaeon]
MNVDVKKFGFIPRRTRRDINLMPLQTGSLLTPEARKALLEWGDGYSVCDYCTSVLDEIKKPPIADFVHRALPDFLDMDNARITGGAREGMFAVMHALAKRGGWVLADGNAHYSTLIGAERAGLEVRMAQSTGAPEYKITPEAFESALEQGKQEFGASPVLAVVTYPDGNYGNLPDAERIGKLLSDNDIPLLLNGAYCVGRMPVSGRRLHADFVVGSGHKSMASAGPIGVLGVSDAHAPEVLKKSVSYPIKELEFLGCTARGVALMTLIASFPHLVERTAPENWQKEVENAQWFAGKLDGMGFELVGDVPHMHDLMFFLSEPFYEISKKVDRYFLYRELKQRSIHGIKPGLTKHFKLSTYGVGRKKLGEVVDAFEEIIGKYSQ